MLRTFAKPLLWLSALAGVGLVAFAVYLQVFRNVRPCPLCILQRYAFLAVSLFAVLTAVGILGRLFKWCGILSALAGAGCAAYQIVVMSRPQAVCGRDAVEVFVNGLYPAKAMPTLFQATAMCTDKLDPILGLTPPWWALVWFAGFCVVFFLVGFSRKR